MAQVTKDFLAQMLVHCERKELPPLTINEARQLAYMAQACLDRPAAREPLSAERVSELVEEWYDKDAGGDVLVRAVESAHAIGVPQAAPQAA